MLATALYGLRARSGVLAAVICLAVLASTTVRPQTLTLHASLVTVYNFNPALLAARKDADAAGEGYVQAKEAFGPSATASVLGQTQRARVDQSQFGIDYTTNDVASTYDANLGFSQPLYTGGRLTAQAKAARADALTSRTELRVTESRVFDDAVTAFVTVLHDQRVIEAASHSMSLLENDLSSMEARLEAGAATLSDRAQVIARLAAARSQLSSARAALASSEATFVEVVGRSPADLAQVDDLPGLPPSLKTAMALAEIYNPSLRETVFQEESARSRTQVARAESRPSVSLRLTAESAPINPFNAHLYDKSLTAGVLVQWPLYTSGRDQSAVRQAQDQDSAALLRLANARRTMTLGVTQSWAALISSRDIQRLVAEQVRADRAAYSALVEQYRAGLISTIDLLNSEQELTSAEVGAADADRQRIVAEADVLVAIGFMGADVLLPDTQLYRPEVTLRTTLIGGRWAPTTALAKTLDRLGAHAPAEQKTRSDVGLADHEPQPMSPSLGDMDPLTLSPRAPLQ